MQSACHSDCMEVFILLSNFYQLKDVVHSQVLELFDEVRLILLASLLANLYF